MKIINNEKVNHKIIKNSDDSVSKIEKLGSKHLSRSRERREVPEKDKERCHSKSLDNLEMENDKKDFENLKWENDDNSLLNMREFSDENQSRTPS